MAANNLKTTNGSSVVDRGLRVGLEQAATSENFQKIEVQMTVGQEKMVMDLANLLGLSVRTLLNSALRYALHDAKRQRIEPNELKEFPKRLSGRIVPLELTIETASQVRKHPPADLSGCTVAGIKLLHERILKLKPAGN